MRVKDFVFNGMNKTFLLWLTFLITGYSATAQVAPVGNYRFDGCTITDLSGNTDSLQTGSPLTCECGINGDALVFDGASQFINLSASSSAGLFTRASLSVSFFFRPTAGSGQMILLSKKETCLSNNGFSIKYNANTREVIVEFEESANNRVVLRGTIDLDRCWQHIVVSRGGRRHDLYINNQLKQTTSTNLTLNLTNDAPLLIGSGPCVGSTDIRFRGLLNNLQFYSPELTPLQTNALFVDQDKLLNRDTTIFLGSSFQARPSVDCGFSYSWNPTLGVSDPASRNPVLNPTQTTAYIYSVNYGTCIARDTLNVTVIDPSLLDCENLPMPNAFTPNGDGLNETYFISNPYTYDELIRFDIYERNGGIVFSTNNSFESWDGTFKGQPMAPGTYLFMIQFRCGEKVINRTGSFVLIR
jgi:gliding motility-associated-like protein